MLTTVEGIYENGRIELQEKPSGVTTARVLVTFLPEEARSHGKLLEYGKYAGTLKLDEEDFQAAEWHGEDEGPDGHSVRS